MSTSSRAMPNGATPAGPILKAGATLIALASLCAAGPAQAAGAWDSFVNSATSSVLDTAKSTFNNAVQGAQGGQQSGSPAGTPNGTPSSTQPGTQPNAQPPAHGSTSPQPAAYRSGALPCVSEAQVDSQWKSIWNGCSTGIWVITSAPGRCFHSQITTRTQQRMTNFHQVVAVCRRTGKEFEATTCQCPEGTAITPGDAIAVTAVSVEAAQTQATADAANGLDKHGCPLRKDDPRWAQVPPGLPKGVCRKS